MLFTNIIWQPQLSLFRGALLIAAVAVWLVVIYIRIAKRHSGWRLKTLFFPKAVVAMLLLLLFFDPVLTTTRNTRRDLRFLVLIDNSSSMEVMDRDETSRYARAERIADILERRLPNVEFENTFFTDRVVGQPQNDGAAVQPTELARILLDIEERQATGIYDGVIVLTDGGDERFEPFRMPSMPLYLIATGVEPGLHNDIEIHAVEAPVRVELDTAFDFTVTLRAYGESGFLNKLGRQRLDLEELSENNKKWRYISHETVDLRSGWADLKMTVPESNQEGERKFRLLAQAVKGELTQLNNERRLSVTVEEQRLRVLLYTRMLGQNESMLRRMLTEDPGVELTSLIRLSGERFVLKGVEKKENSRLLESFPDSVAQLQPFRTIIIGSFPADDWTEEQMRAVVEFVAHGGSVVFLGGEDSFGRGGYAGTLLDVLLPWIPRDDEPEPVLKQLDVAVAPAVTAQEVIKGWAEKMSAAHPLYLHSINLPGRLRPGAVSLLNVLHDGENIPVIAIQPYGRGRVMGVATDTIWRWRIADRETRAAYDHFWSAGIRYIAGLEHGSLFLRIEFDKEPYHPGERAEIKMHVIGDYPEGSVNIQVDKFFQDEKENVAVEQRPGAGQEFKGRTLFRNRGDHTFKFTVFTDNHEIETHTRQMWVGARLNEGANIYVDHEFLNTLAARSGEELTSEDDLDPLIARIGKSQIVRDQQQTESVVQYRGIYLLLITLILVGEWIARRRLDLF